ncbi:MAG: hypothetical protein Q9190_006235 [Brigantiaea leucoxantha]
MNVSASLNFFKLIRNPALCLPHATIPTFNDLPVPLSALFGAANPDIRAVILDKDNCFARSKENVIYEPYRNEQFLIGKKQKFHALRTAYPGNGLLIVSNSAGTDDDPNNIEGSALADATGVQVFRHSTKKPGCGKSILNHLQNAKGSCVTSPSQVVVVGDRLFTDVIMANLIGSWAVWIKDGVTPSNNPQFARWEQKLPEKLVKRGFNPPAPPSLDTR